MDIVKSIIHWIISIIDRILNIRIVDIPLVIVYCGVTIMIGYIASLFIIGFPCTIIEAITKKKIPDEIEDKIIRIGTIIFSSVFAILVLNE